MLHSQTTDGTLLEGLLPELIWLIHSRLDDLSALDAPISTKEIQDFFCLNIYCHILAGDVRCRIYFGEDRPMLRTRTITRTADHIILGETTGTNVVVRNVVELFDLMLCRNMKAPYGFLGTLEAFEFYKARTERSGVETARQRNTSVSGICGASDERRSNHS